MPSNTKEQLLDTGLEMLLRQGYSGLGIQSVLREAGVPKGSFYHFFSSKEDFALQVVDRYMANVHEGLDLALGDDSLPPLERVRRFFELSRDKYESEGRLGCLLGGLGQELAGVSETFQAKIEGCFLVIVGRITDCLEEARQRGELPAHNDPADMANLLLNCWEGAALRSRLWRNTAPLDAMLDFYFTAAKSA
jgi:TetR/AcrR family transcriptional regulator, transcriptional repressor for nem operon